MWIELIHGNRYVCNSVMFEARTPTEVDDEFGEYLLGCETKYGVPYFREVREPAEGRTPQRRRPPQRVATSKKKSSSKKKKSVSTRAMREQRQEGQETSAESGDGEGDDSEDDGFEL